MALSLPSQTQKPAPESGLFKFGNRGPQQAVFACWGDINAGDHLISHTLSRAVPSAQRGLTSVFGMGTGGTLAVWSPANLVGAWRAVFPAARSVIRASSPGTESKAFWRHINTKSIGLLTRLVECLVRTAMLRRVNFMIKPNGRLVLVSYTHYCASTSSLSTRWSSWALQGNLILERASRLDAFSGYHNRTSLPSRAIGMTTGTQEVRPSRSSRTKDSPPQISYAHSR